MPSLESYRKIYQAHGKTEGQNRKYDSDLIMDATWDGDIQSKVAYIYDYFHDEEPLKLRDLHPEHDHNKIPIDIKYIVNGSQTYDKDPITYHIQLKPFYKRNVPYYKETFEDRYSSIFPLGMYIDIPDNNGVFNRWLIVDKANYYDLQFSTFEILACDYVFQWIHNGHKHQMAGVLRSQNSYNSGLWTDLKITTVEDQQKFIVPLNKVSEHLYYRQRMIIDAPVTEREPNTWEISKVKSFAPNALNRITLAQVHFDQHHDYIEKDIHGNIIGMWASYYTDNVPLNEQNHEAKEATSKSEILFSGMKPELKIGGSYKTFTMNYFDHNGEPIIKENYSWQFELNSSPVSDDVIKTILPDSSNKLSANQIKIKFIGTDDYLNSILTIKNENTSLDIKIVGM